MSASSARQEAPQGDNVPGGVLTVAGPSGTAAYSETNNKRKRDSDEDNEDNQEEVAKRLAQDAAVAKSSNAPPKAPLTLLVEMDGSSKRTTGLDLPFLLKLGITTINVPWESNLTTSAAIPKGFLDLPHEIRHQIYDLVFKADEPVQMGVSDTAFSAQFLRTCKKVHEEGSKVLYGENSFHFTRDTNARGKFWETIWPEIGYKDVLGFFKMIGPANIGQLNYLSFRLVDNPAPVRLWSKTQIECQRFVDDPDLQKILRLIGANATLKIFAVHLYARRTVTKNDLAFVQAISTVRCHNLHSIDFGWTNQQRVTPDVMNKMKEAMIVRDEDGNRIVDPKKAKPTKMIHETGAGGIYRVTRY